MRAIFVLWCQALPAPLSFGGEAVRSRGCPLAIARLCQRRRGAKRLGRRGEAPLKGCWGRVAHGRPDLCGATRVLGRNKKQKTLEVALQVV